MGRARCSRLTEPACYRITHRCQEQRFLLKFALDRRNYVRRLRQMVEGYRVSVLDYRDAVPRAGGHGHGAWRGGAGLRAAPLRTYPPAFLGGPAVRPPCGDTATGCAAKAWVGWKWLYNR